MATIEVLATTLRSVLVPGMTPKALRAAVRERHPEASRKEIVRAAFYALTDPAADGAALADLHGFALDERSSDEEAEPKPSKTLKRRKTKRAAA